jgi:hypothetical protein
MGYPSSIRGTIRIRRERAGLRGRPASIVKAARVRKSGERNRLRIHDDLGGLNVGDGLGRRIIGLNDRRFLNHLRVGWRIRRNGAGITPRSNLLVV